MNQKFALIIFGPTASGKTSLGIKIAQKLDATIINADSRQVYQEMPIITAMPSEEEFATVPHMLFNFLKPDEKISVDRYTDMAKSTCYNLFNQNKLPIFVGGTGFYLKVLTEGMSPTPHIPEKIIQELTNIAKNSGIKELYTKLKNIDSILANKLKPQDTHRIIRGLSVYEHTQNTLSSYQNIPQKQPMPDVKFIKIALIPPREILYKKIHERFEIMLEKGVLKEAEKLHNKNYDISKQSLNSLGLKELFAYINGEIDFHKAKEKTLQQMRNYAKRQTTWLNNQYNADITITDGKNIDINKLLSGYIDLT